MNGFDIRRRVVDVLVRLVKEGMCADDIDCTRFAYGRLPRG